MTATTTRTTIERTEHPHVIKGGGLGGQPRIDDQRISVLQIFALHEAGETTEQILLGHPTLTPAEVHDAISYAYDHPDEMDYWTERRKLRNVLKHSDMVYVEGRLIPRRGLDRVTLPVGAKIYTWETLPPEFDE
ncbi:MAG TPA: DUF433 domain-containing protein [Thermomicrobiales bacterium]|jgi:uncharacterized protein (DUF433 family)